jgi:FkbM family methyltransferase
MPRRTATSLIHGISSRIKRVLTPDPDRFLRNCRSVIHIGANDGGERDLYARYKLTVLWVEASPDIFQTLVSNLRDFPIQEAVNALVTDKAGESYEFHISNNLGASSSIFELKKHTKLWPDVTFTKSIRLKSTTPPALLRASGQTVTDFDALILDVQGAELLVIEGAGQVLDSIRFIKAEAADFESYREGCTGTTLSEALTKGVFNSSQGTFCLQGGSRKLLRCSF